MTLPTTPTLRAAEPHTIAVPEGKARAENFILLLFIVIPFLAIAAAVPFAWGWGLSWLDVVLFVVFYGIGGHGITVGFHRYFTHGSFKAKPWVKKSLAIAGSLAIEGPVMRWVADHRRHHTFSDRDGDPHSPWRYGESIPALLKGLWWSHMGWMFDREKTNPRRYVPDLVDDEDLQRISRQFPLWVAVSLLAPPVLGGLISWSWHGALTAFFWASLVRVGLLHHTTWAINSICHAVGAHPFNSRDRSGNVWWLAIPSMGESWHNLHHADPTSARHGVLRGQVDTSARIIRIMEKLGWVWDVRWPRPERLAAKRMGAAKPVGATRS